ncbi:MAG: YhdP family protein [Polaromonas sp.]
MAPRRLRWIAVALRWLLGLLALAWLLLALSLGVLHGWIVPRIDALRPRLEQSASQALGVPVRIGQITAQSSGLTPTFELRDVRLLDAQGREALRLPYVLGAMSLSSLWVLGFEQLVIDSPELNIRRSADGQVFVGGLEVSKDRATGHSAVADWLFSQTEFVVRGGTVRWTDEMRQAPPLALNQVDAVLRNGRRRHQLRLDATPPPEWGERFSLRGLFRQPLLKGSAGDFASWSGQLYGDFSRVDVSLLKQYASLDSLGLAINRGRGALRAWVDVSKGQASGALADVALQDVDLKLGSRLEALGFESIAGRISGEQNANGFSLATEALTFRTRDGVQWPGGNVALTHTRRAAGGQPYTSVKADRLDLATLARIGERLPLPDEAHKLLASFAPQGLVQTVDAHWQGALDAPQKLAAKGRVTGLQLAAQAAPASAPAGSVGRPGVSGADLDFDVTDTGGQARVSISRGALELPGVFEEARLPLERLSTEAQWKLAGPKIDLQLRNLQFANADAQGQAQVRWQTHDAVAVGPPRPGGAPDPRFPGVLDLQGSLSRGDGSRVHRYLPLVLDEEVRHYVRDAVVKGQVSDVKFKVKGPIEQLPFAHPAQGDFQVSGKVRGGHFVYVPAALQPPGAAPWPALTELSGELLFSRASLEVKNVSGKVAGLAGLQLVKGDARIADLMHQASVEVNTQVKGLLADALGFVNTSPLGEMTGKALAGATASGAADYQFRLKLPLHDIEKSTVQGRVSLSGNDVRFAPDTPLLGQLKGVVNVTDSGFSVAGAQARVLGGDMRIDGGTRPAASAAEDKTVVAFKAQGTVTAEGLRQAGLPALVARLAEHASGSAAYTASLMFRRGVAEFGVSSSLQGMALNLPAPLAKTAEAALALRYDNALVPASMAAGRALQDQLFFGLGNVAALNYLRDVSGEQPRVLRGGIGVGLQAGEAVPEPESGVGANINLAQLDLDAWEKIFGDAPASSAAPTQAGTADSAAAYMAYLPTQLSIRARQLKVDGRQLNHVVAGASRDGANWRANIDAEELDGYIEFRQPGAQGAGRVYARLSRLSLAASRASEVEALLDEPPTSIPALDIVVEDMELRGRKLGRVEIDAVNRSGAAAGGGREWQLNKFNVVLPEATLTASGSWGGASSAGAQRSAARPRSERRRAVMDFTLDIADSGELLKRFGMPGVIRRGKGQLEGQIAWSGSPLSLDYPSLNGQFNINVESGQFMKAEPGMAKLLGVLSLQSLPRRLTLDFRDVFSQGFAFDFVRGDVTIAQGVAQTSNLQMSGVNAAVLMDGSADLARETQRLRVVVVPELDAGTASLIATVINPAIGLGSFLAQLFLRRPLTEAATQEFQIDGTWADPKITKIDRKARAKAQAGDATSKETR